MPKRHLFATVLAFFVTGLVGFAPAGAAADDMRTGKSSRLGPDMSDDGTMHTRKGIRRGPRLSDLDAEKRAREAEARVEEEAEESASVDDEEEGEEPAQPPRSHAGGACMYGADGRLLYAPSGSQCAPRFQAP